MQKQITRIGKDAIIRYFTSRINGAGLFGCEGENKYDHLVSNWETG